MKVLIIEDGLEYTDAANRFLSEGYTWVRAGNGLEAIKRVQDEEFQAILLDMCFDRIPVEELLGDLTTVSERWDGDRVRGQRFLEQHQGNYILAGLRAEGCALPVLFSYDFDDEPKRWDFLLNSYGPIAYLPDNHGPKELNRMLRQLMEPSKG